MRDPHIIIGAFIEKKRRETKAGLIMTAHQYDNGTWRAAVVGHGSDTLVEARGVSLDAAMCALAVAVDSAEHILISDPQPDYSLRVAARRVVTQMGGDGTAWYEELQDSDPLMLSALVGLRNALEQS